jgi:LEA14-like dessication related protein
MKQSYLSVFRLSALALILLICSSAGCNKVKELEYRGIKQTKIESIGLNQSAIRIDLGYFNPNAFGLDVKETNLSVYLNDKFIAIADQPEKTQIPKLAEFVFPVIAHFEPLNILGTAFGSIFSRSNKLTIQGSAKIGKGGVYIRVPVSITENVNLLSN